MTKKTFPKISNTTAWKDHEHLMLIIKSSLAFTGKALLKNESVIPKLYKVMKSQKLPYTELCQQEMHLRQGLSFRAREAVQGMSGTD